MRLIKTKDIRNVPIKANQLIFSTDGSMWFDYDDKTRLCNAGEGSQLVDYKNDVLYRKDSMVFYNNFIYRALVTCKDNTWVPSHWEALASVNPEALKVVADQVEFTPTGDSGLESTSVASALEELADKIKAIEDSGATEEKEYVIGDF